MWTKSTTPRELALFPLPDVVLFPGCLLPLHIFEHRYREMVSEAMLSDKLFGILNWDQVTRTPADVGCVAEIIELEKLPDGRSNILAMGRQRFRVIEFQHERSFLTGTVEWVDDRQTDADLKLLADGMHELLRDVVRLSAKLADKSVEYPSDVPSDPAELSFWIAGSFPALPGEQQSLLEMNDTAGRLQREFEILGSARKHLAARTALKDAFSSSS